MAFFNAMGGVASLLLVVLLGFALARRGWFAPASRALLPKLVTNVSLPPFLFSIIGASMPHGALGQILSGVTLPLLSMCGMFALACIAGRLFHVSRRHFGLFCACVSNPNTIFIGIPVNMALFGPEALPYVLIYYFGSTCFFWTVGNYVIARDERAPGQKAAEKRGLAHKAQQILSPPMIGFLAGLLFVVLDWRLPSFLAEAAKSVGALSTPLALIFVGITLEGMNWRKFKLTRDIALALVGRLVVNPLFVWALLPFFHLPELMGKVFVMQSSLPVIMQIAILSAYYNTDPEFGSLMVSLSTILCALTIPLYMVLL